MRRLVIASVSALLCAGCLAPGIHYFDTASSPAPAVAPSPYVVPSPVAPAGVTMEKFLSIREGMTYFDVVAILGSEGEEISRSSLGGTTTVMYQWKGSGSLGANMNAMFQGGKLISKAQFGLR